MKKFLQKKDLPSLLVLLVLITVLAFIYIKPESITGSLSDRNNGIEHIIYNDNYELKLSDQEKLWLKNSPTIKLGIDRAFPPFGSVTSYNEYIGFSADFMRIMEHRLNINFDIDHAATWNETMQMAKSGELDIVAALVNTKQRQGFLDFTQPYISNPTVIISDAINKGYIGSLENLNGQKVAIEEGSYAYEEIALKYPEIELIPVKNTNLALSLVATNVADAYVGNAITASYLIKMFGHQNLTFSGETDYSSDHSIGVRKGNEILLGIFQKALESISLENRKAITNYWFGMKVEKSISTNTIVKIGATFFSLLLILLAWSFSLRKTKNELKYSQTLIKLEAEQDHLTGLGNRRKFYQLLEEEIQKAEKTGDSFYLLQLDFDSFKEINDNFGHSVGDLLIVEAAKRINNYLSTNDIVTRLSGDEFMLIISNSTNKNNIELCAEKIKTSMSNTFYLDENEVHTSVSIGITVYPHDATSSEQLVNNVDQATFHSKKLGKNRFSHFTSSMKNEIILRNNMIKDLRLAIKENQFELHYQPIIDIATNKITKAEALIRWNHPTRGLVSPDSFIPLAEETGLIIEIGEWVFKKSVEDTVKIKKLLNTDFQMSINTSPLQYGKNGMNVSDWFSHIITSGLSGKNIALEITESVLMESSDSIKNKLYNLRDLDVQISIDDFGTGYSSLSYLKKFDIDYLKIDRSFVQNLCEDSDDLVLIQAIIIMAHKLGCKVIAEGIENETQLAMLAKEGCDYGQGYYFAKPLASNEFMRLLKHWEDNNTSDNSDSNVQVIPFNKLTLDKSSNNSIS
ncbi:MAG: EAL domain-containing protein [Cocleimonas sp.]